MNIRNWKSSILLSLAAGGLGYCLNTGREAAIFSSSAHTIAPVEDFESPASFSEIENSKSLLDAECRRFVVELRTKWVPALNMIPAGDKRASSVPRRTTNRINPVLEIKQKIEEFKGTEQEFLLVGELLTVLRWEKHHSQWLDTYLRILYQHPTQPLLGQWAVRAIEVGRITGREHEVLSAFRHLRSIPLDFDTKAIVTSAFADIETPNGPLVARWP